MKQFNIEVLVTALQRHELTEIQLRLADAALEATHRSYAPYSHFSVGAAILLSNGQIVTGSNQENAAFPSGTCAERTAAFYAHSAYPDATFQTIAIAARDSSGAQTPYPISPCGACRQALLEFETLAGHDIPLLLIGEQDIYLLPSIRSLLPLAFSEF